MRKLFTVTFSVLSFVTFGQDTTYYDQKDNEVTAFEEFHEYKVVHRNDIDTSKALVRVFFGTGQIKSERTYNPYSKKILQGKSKEWYESGQIRREIEYDNGNYHGQLLTYWENGQLKRSDKYKEGKLNKGKVWNEDGKEVEYYDYEKMPIFPGGEKELFKYLGSNIRYPKESRRKGIQGIIYLNFTVEQDGSLSNIKVLKGVSDDIDGEALRVINNMPNWEPGMHDGEKVAVSYNLPINFSLK